MKQKHQKKREEELLIAKERVDELFRQAEQIFPKYPKLSNRYVQIARKISMKYKVKIPAKLQKRFCKHCYSYLVPSINCRIRTKQGHLVYYCLKCKKFMRFPYK